MTLPIGGLARRLVSNGLLNEAQAFSSMELAKRTNTSWVSQLVAGKLIDSRTIAQTVAVEFGTPLFDLSTLDPQYSPANLVNPSLISQHHMLPIYRRGNQLFLAVSDPANLTALNEIKFHTGMTVDAVVVEEEELTLAIERFIEQQESSEKAVCELHEMNLEELKFEIDLDEETDQDIDAADTAPVVKAVNKILLDAIKSGASDIHLEPYEKTYRIRFRTDGVLHEIAKPPISIAGRISARLKIMSQMDISERRIPQDGRIRLKLSRQRSIDFRVSTLPTLWGEKIVLRILDPSQTQLGVDSLGFEKSQKKLFTEALQKTQGMILVTGPTGSGKTVSLYTGLGLLNTAHRNISTAEDPVEINLEGINQVQINTRTGLGFATTLRAFLRQDPDVIMVGEVRDLETAEIAIKAAQTGHLVLSTLHTNSAPEAVTRLLNMGIPAYNLATSLTLVIAQRLARRLCGHCKEITTLPEKLLKEEGVTEQFSTKLVTYRATGCKHCRNGYKGRVAIYEVVPITEAVSRIIIRNGNSLDIAEQARKEGFYSLRRSALLKVAQGLTSLEEANRLT
ncbi:MAG: type IV-A pilus assembly ATPase PilB [Gammaproteobacteria bacterium]|nr:type IV-A pilus assembly ATPase PilB [Gammaproteobacteria bacterium]